MSDQESPVRMCGSFDCDCPTTAEFEEIMERLDAEHHRQARLIVEQLAGSVLGGPPAMEQLDRELFGRIEEQG